VKLSVITPTHDVRHLASAYASLRNQTHTEWEWIVAVNGGATYDQVAAIIKGDARVAIARIATAAPTSIGAIKHKAFMLGTGEALVELDHDDMLTSDALAEIAHAFAEPSVGFVYSNSADFFPNGNGHWYPDWQRNGWRYRQGMLGAHPINECVAFKPSASSLSTILYAPNHVRAWRRDFYRAIGGHDPAMPIADDHELLVRTYLRGRMHHIDRCLYLYRMGANTFSGRIDEIAARSHAIYVANLEQLVVREGGLRGLPCYDLGGAFGCPDGWTPVDRNLPTNSAGVRADLNERWPWADSSVMAFRAHDIVEHLHDKQHTMREIHRCLVPGGWALINVPSTDGRGAFQDPTHVSFWNENSFWYWTRPEQAAYIDNKDHMFITRRLFTCFPNDWHRANQISYVVAELVAIKGDMSDVPGVRP
jgi:glycosyltransferase involved in cell wall biosynthesis